MQKFSFLIYLLLTTTLAYTQTTLTWGVRPSVGLGFYEMDIPTDDFQPATSVTGGIALLLDVPTSETFSVRLNNHLSTKQLKFNSATVLEDYNSTLHVNYISWDASVSGRFHLKVNKMVFVPEVGIGISTNKYTDWRFTTKLNSGTSGDTPPPSFGELESEDIFIHPTVVTGLGWFPNITANNRLGLNLNFVYNPVDFIRDEQIIPFENGNIDIRGTYHYLVMGVEYLFGK